VAKWLKGDWIQDELMFLAGPPETRLANARHHGSAFVAERDSLIPGNKVPRVPAASANRGGGARSCRSREHEIDKPRD